MYPGRNPQRFRFAFAIHNNTVVEIREKNGVNGG